MHLTFCKRLPVTVPRVIGLLSGRLRTVPRQHMTGDTEAQGVEEAVAM